MKFRPLVSVVLLAVLSPSSYFASDLLKLRIIEAQRYSEPKNPLKPIDIRVDDDSRQQFARWTTRYAVKTMSVLIDGRTVSEPRILTPLTGGTFQIAGVLDDEIDNLSQRLADGRSTLAVEVNDY
ncbi:preprotein translocase subunit SecD [Rhodoblastus acidophilus]|uniref:SecDF P1 head subdomain-containing protein n=1 Tax=Rhodoblastus acidophilus TaxID=1074 RepID=UPI002224C27C|nr:hypothetical protein [Rhodoblastus acidophilus]MCW2318887.1 preprotein translocase subunit SecD [Rhodoblastus acidophilus]